MQQTVVSFVRNTPLATDRRGIRTVRDIDIDLHPTLLDDLKDSIRSRAHWKKVANVTECLAHICLGLTTILAFVASVYRQLSILLLLAGVTSALSLVLLKYSAYATNECEERHRVVCGTLKYFKVEEALPPVMSPQAGDESIITPTHPSTPVL